MIQVQRWGRVALACTIALLAFCPSSAASGLTYYWKSPIAVHSACDTASAANIIDWDFETAWHHWVEETHWVILDLGESYTVSGVRQWHERKTDSECGIAAVYVSENTTNWGASLGSLGNTHNLDPGWIEADITEKQGRYAKFVTEHCRSPYWREVQVEVEGEADVEPPAAITDLSVSRVGSASVILSWTATGDDGSVGTASRYDLRYSPVEITPGNWDSATSLSGEPTPSASGSTETMAVTGLDSTTTYYFALKVQDEMWNELGLSNVISATTTTRADGVVTLDESDVYKDFIAGQHVDGAKTLVFRLFRPAQFDNGEDYPLIVFLHGNGAQGEDNQKQIAHPTTYEYYDGIRPWINPDKQAEHPAFILAPQCPSGNIWVDSHWSYGSYDLDLVPESDDLAYVVNIIRYLVDAYHIDENRVFVTGGSMGGVGTWDLLLRHPDLFVGGMPVCGCGSPNHASNIKDVPIWTFHGALDTTISVECSRDMVNALQAVGGDIQYTEYPDVYHDATRYAYYEPETIDWVYGLIDPELTLRLTGSPADRAIRLDWSVAGTLPATGTWHIDYYTTTASAPFTATDPFSITRAYALTDHVVNYQWYTVTLHAMVGSTSWVSDMVRVMPTDIVVYLPLLVKED